MSGSGDQRVTRALVARLAEGPADALALLEAVRPAAGPAFAGQEAAFHALLLRLLRTDLAHVVLGSGSGATRYAAGPAPVPGGPGGQAAGAAHGAARLDVQKAVRSLRHADDRVRVAADVEAHLAALDAAHRREAFGPLGALKGMLKRADRGQPAVYVAEGFGGHVLRFLLQEGPWILAAGALFAVLYAFVLRVYVIPSPSMVPTLQIGDRVVVRLKGGDWRPERWQVVTFQRPGKDGPKTTFVKRVVGLPGERIALWRGDVYVNGSLVAKPETMSALLRSRVKAWDLTTTEGRHGWLVDDAQTGVDRWTNGERWWTGTFDTERRFELQDVYLDLDVDLGQGGATLVLSRGTGPGEVAFKLESHPREGLTLDRLGAGAQLQERLASDRALHAGRRRLSLALVDGVLDARVGGWSWRRSVAGLPAEAARWQFLVRDGATPLTFRLDQDLHYAIGEGVHAVAKDGKAKGWADTEHQVGADAVFCLGDNTSNSEDSRSQSVGDIPLSQLIGPVVWRIWPPGRIGGIAR